MADLKVETELTIFKSPAEIYEAIVNPEHMKNYFITSGSGRLDAGDHVTWYWADHGNANLTVAPKSSLAEKEHMFYTDSKRYLCGSGRAWAARQRPVRLVTGHPNSAEAPSPLPRIIIPTPVNPTPVNPPPVILSEAAAKSKDLLFQHPSS